jgi:hypothetical protein
MVYRNYSIRYPTWLISESMLNISCLRALNTWLNDYFPCNKVYLRVRLLQNIRYNSGRLCRLMTTDDTAYVPRVAPSVRLSHDLFATMSLDYHVRVPFSSPASSEQCLFPTRFQLKVSTSLKPTLRTKLRKNSPSCTGHWTPTRLE